MWKDGTSGDVSMVTLAVRSDVCKGTVLRPSWARMNWLGVLEMQKAFWPGS